jgi:enoyl-[acyl-carrier protein] reductase II
VGDFPRRFFVAENRLCKLLGIRYPILMGGMLWVGTARLAAAVSNSEGLGMIAASNVPIKDLDREIELLRFQSSHPFGVNVPIFNPLAAEHCEYLRNSKKVPIVVTSAGNPKHYTKKLKDAEITVLHVVSNVEEARKAEEAGVDAVIAEGVEAGGHNGRDELATLTLVPQVADAVRIPVVAAGGICEGRGFLAALALGAEGVQLGTRFIATEECEVHPHYKSAIINSQDTDSVLIARKAGLRRVLKTPYTQKVLDAESRGATAEEMKSLLDRNRSRLAIQGDLENGIFPAGQGVGLIKEVLTTDEVIQKIISQYKVKLQELNDKAMF